MNASEITHNLWSQVDLWAFFQEQPLPLGICTNSLCTHLQPRGREKKGYCISGIELARDVQGRGWGAKGRPADVPADIATTARTSTPMCCWNTRDVESWRCPSARRCRWLVEKEDTLAGGTAAARAVALLRVQRQRLGHNTEDGSNGVLNQVASSFVSVAWARHGTWRKRRRRWEGRCVGGGRMKGIGGSRSERGGTGGG